MTLSRLLTAAALVWLASAAYLGFQGLPQIPLDVSAADPATVDALNAARLQHGLTYAVIGLAPLLLLVIARRIWRH